MARLGRVTDPDGESLTLSEVSKISKAYKEVGISLYDATGEFMGMEEAMAQLHEKWGDLSTAQKNYIAESSAGTRQINTFKIWMDNYDRIQELTKLAQQSQGTAMKNQEIYNDSYTASITNFGNAVDSLKIDILDNGLTKDFIQLGTNGVNAIDGIVKSLGGLGTAIAAIGASKGLSVLGKFLTGSWDDDSKNPLGGSWKTISTFGSKIKAAVSDFSKAFSKASAAEGATFGKSLSAGADAAIASFGGLNAAILGVSAGVAIYKMYKDNQQAVIDNGKQATKDWENQKKSVNDYAEQYKELKTRLDSGNLSESETIATKQQILDLQTQIVSQYGEQVSGIDLVNGRLLNELDLIQSITQEEAKKALLDADNAESYRKAKKYMEKSRSESFSVGGALNSDIENIFRENGFVIENGYATLTNKTAEEISSALFNTIDRLGSYNTSDDLTRGSLDYIIDDMTLSYNDYQQGLSDYQETYKTFMQLTLIANGLGDELSDYELELNTYLGKATSGDVKGILESRKRLDEIRKEMDTAANGDDDTLKYIDNLINYAEKAIGKEGLDKKIDFMDIFDGDGIISDGNQFAKQAERIEEYGDKIKEIGLDTADVYTLLSKYSMLSGPVQKLAEIFGVDTNDDSAIRQFADFLGGMGLVKVAEDTATEAGEAFGKKWSDTVKSEKEEDKTFSDKTSTFTSNAEKINEALDSLRSGQKLTTKDLIDLAGDIPGVNDLLSEINELQDISYIPGLGQVQRAQRQQFDKIVLGSKAQELGIDYNSVLANDGDVAKTALEKILAKTISDYTKAFVDEITNSDLDEAGIADAKEYFKGLMSQFIGQDLDWDQIRTNLYKDVTTNYQTLFGREFTLDLASNVTNMVQEYMDYIKEGSSVSSYGEAVTKTTDLISDYSSKLETLNKAQEEYMQKGRLSAQTMADLESKGYNINQVLEGMNKGFGDLTERTMKDFEDRMSNITAQLPEEEQAGFTMYWQAQLEEMSRTSSFGAQAVSAAKNSLSVVNQAISEMNSTTGLTSETMDNIMGMFANIKEAEEDIDLSQLFYNTADGVKLNVKAMKELSDVKFLQSQEKFTAEIKKTKDALLTESDKLKRGEGSLKDYERALDQLNKTRAALAEAYANYKQEQEALSKFAMWQAAKSEQKQGYEYETVQSAVAGVREMVTKGRWNNPEVRAFAEMLSPSGVFTGMDQLGKNLATAERYFTEDAKVGMNNFMDDLKAFGIAEEFADGGVKVKAHNIKDLTEQFWKNGKYISEDMMRYLVGMAQEYGMSDTFVDTKTEGGLKTQDFALRYAEQYLALKKLRELQAENPTDERAGEIEALEKEMDITKNEAIALGESIADIDESPLRSLNTFKDAADGLTEFKEAILNSDLDSNTKAYMLDLIDEKLRDVAKQAGLTDKELDELMTDDGFDVEGAQEAIQNIIDATANLDLEYNVKVGMDLSDMSTEELDQRLEDLEGTKATLEAECKVDTKEYELLEQEIQNTKFKKTITTALDNGSTMEELSSMTKEEYTAMIGAEPEEGEFEAFQEYVNSQLEEKELPINVKLDDTQFLTLIEAITGKPYEVDIKGEFNGEEVEEDIKNLNSKKFSVPMMTPLKHKIPNAPTTAPVLKKMGILIDEESKEEAWSLLNQFEQEDRNTVIKAEADTSQFESAVKKMEDADYEAEIDVEANTSAALRGITELGGTQRVKVDVDAPATPTKIQSTKETTETVTRNESTVKNVTATASGGGAVAKLTQAIGQVKAKTVPVGATTFGQAGIKGLSDAIAGVNSKTVNVAVTVAGTDKLTDAKLKIDSMHDKTVTMQTNVITRHIEINETLGKSHGFSGTFNSNFTGELGRYASGTVVEKSGSAYNVMNMKPIGNAHANGTGVALDHDEKALVNELG